MTDSDGDQVPASASPPQGAALRGTAGADGFDLFISYVRKDARRLIAGRRIDVVAAFKAACERHRDPVRGQRFRVCTDVEDFDLSGTLESTIARRIDASGALMLISSTGVPCRKVVHAEVDRFVERQEGRPLMAAYLDLQPWDALPSRFAPDTAAVDLAPAEGATAKEWRFQLERESHKAVAWAWGLSVRKVHDRSAADLRRGRLLAASGFAASAVAVTAAVALAGGTHGYHRVAELTLADRVVAPVAVGFAGAGAARPTLVASNSIQAWAAPTRNGLVAGRPEVIGIGRYTSRAQFLPDGRLIAARGRSVELFDVDRKNATPMFEAPDEIVGLAVAGGSAVPPHRVAVATKDGRAFVGAAASGSFHELPRPETVLNRRFPPFRERKPVPLGPALALSMDGRWLASAGEAGLLSVVKLSDATYLSDDPVAYETENTRPIGALLFVPGPSPRLLFSEGSDGLRLLDLNGGQVRRGQYSRVASHPKLRVAGGWKYNRRFKLRDD